MTIHCHGETHRADVITSTGLVIEIQHSSISTTEIFARENFYGQKMMWVINAEDFLDHVHLARFPVDIKTMWFSHISSYGESGLGKNYAIKVPIDDFQGVIEPALKKAGFKKTKAIPEEDEFWYNYKKDYKDNKLPDGVYRAFYKYLLNIELLKGIEDDRNSYKTQFRWKHLKKSWLASKNPKFLDLSNGHLLFIETLYASGIGYGRVITKKKFLNKYNR